MMPQLHPKQIVRLSIPGSSAVRLGRVIVPQCPEDEDLARVRWEDAHEDELVERRQLRAAS